MNTKIAVITGANRGLGYAISEKIASIGITVVMVCRESKKSEEAAQMLKAKGLPVVPMKADVSDTKSIDTFAQELQSKFSHIDILINCAAINNEPRDAHIEDMEVQFFHDIMNTNVLGTIWMCKRLLPLLKKSDDARIVNFSSGLGQLSVPRMGPHPTYSISKTAVNAVTKILDDELKDTTVSVFSVDPGWVKTDMGGPNAMLEIPEGIDTAIWLATTSKVEVKSGHFYKERKILGW